MFMQQFCGINVIAYYSATIFRGAWPCAGHKSHCRQLLTLVPRTEAGFDDITALGATLGFGALNFVMVRWRVPTSYESCSLTRVRGLVLSSVCCAQAGPAVWTIDTFGRWALYFQFIRQRTRLTSRRRLQAQLAPLDVPAHVGLSGCESLAFDSSLTFAWHGRSIFLLMAGMAFFIPEGPGRTAVVALGVYLHCALRALTEFSHRALFS